MNLVLADYYELIEVICISKLAVGTDLNLVWNATSLSTLMNKWERIVARVPHAGSRGPTAHSTMLVHLGSRAHNPSTKY